MSIYREELSRPYNRLPLEWVLQGSRINSVGLCTFMLRSSELLPKDRSRESLILYRRLFTSGIDCVWRHDAVATYSVLSANRYVCGMGTAFVAPVV